MPRNQILSRRSFVGLAASLAAGLMAAPLTALEARADSHGVRAPRRGRRRRPEHPDPRPGIDARHVTPREHLPTDAHAAFELVREIPHVVDGIACQCGCAELEDMRSLLSCFEGHGMAQHCMACQGQAELAHEMAGAGRTLDEIRAAVDAQFG